MLQFILPVALLAAIGVIVPVLIHLWRPPARTVRLGSLRYLTAVPGRRLRDLRWRDPLHLLVRVALLLTLAALLAQPIWVHLADGPQRWALRSPHTNFDLTTQPIWRDLLAKGYQPRWLAPGFPDAGGDASAPADSSLDAWSLLREADARVPRGSKLVVFAAPRIATLRGERPPLSHSELKWIPTPAKETATPAAQLGSLALSPDGRNVRATLGASDAFGSRASHLLVATPPEAASVIDPVTGATLELRKSNGTVAGRLVASKPEAWLPARIWRPVRVAIVHGPARADDARYVAAAVRAAGEVADRVITLEVREETSSTILPEADWVFRIGVSPLTAPLSRVLAENNVNVVSDAPLDAMEISAPTWFVAPEDPADVDGVRLWKRVPAGRDARTVLWSDGFGAPLLMYSREGRAERWQFLSRFHPEWTDWVRGGAFPGWICSLVVREPDGAGEPLRDRRLADAGQIEPARATDGTEAVTLPQPADRTTDFHAWLWAGAALLLILERWLSLRAPPAVPATEPLARKSERVLEEVAR